MDEHPFWDPREEARIKGRPGEDSLGLPPTRGKYDDLYEELAPKFSYNPDSGTLTSYRTVRGTPKTRFASGKGIYRSKGKPRPIKAETVQVRLKSGSVVNLSTIKLCFLKAHGYIPERVYTLNGNRRDFRLANLTDTPPARSGDPLSEVEITTSARPPRTTENSATPTNLFSNINIKEPSND